MKKSAIWIGLTLILVLAVSPVSAMIGGDLDDEHSNVGAIIMEWPLLDENLVGRLCSGTLVHERALLTAAHCYKYFVNQKINYDQIWVTFHQDPFNKEAEYLNVAEFIPHEDYNLTFRDSHDIALVILAEPVDDNIVPEQLPEPGYMNVVVDQPNWRELDMIAVGYGITDLANAIPGEAQLDAERRSGSITFRDLTSFEIKTIQLIKQDDVIITVGDSGGPLFHKYHEKNEVLVGLASCKGAPCFDRGIHYRLDTASALDWIDAELFKLE